MSRAKAIADTRSSQNKTAEVKCSERCAREGWWEKENNILEEAFNSPEIVFGRINFLKSLFVI